MNLRGRILSAALGAGSLLVDLSLPVLAAGLFQPAVSYGVGSNPGSVAMGDFNADGKPDLAVANWFAGNVFILLATAGSAVAPESPGAVLLPFIGIAAVELIMVLRGRRTRASG